MARHFSSGWRTGSPAERPHDRLVWRLARFQSRPDPTRTVHAGEPRAQVVLRDERDADFWRDVESCVREGFSELLSIDAAHMVGRRSQ